MNILPLKRLIAQGYLSQTIDKLLALTEGGTHYNETILIALRLVTFQKAVIKGLFSFEEQNRIRINIANQILQLLDFLEKEKEV